MAGRLETACLVVASGRGIRMGGPKAMLIWTDGLPLSVSHARMRTDVRETVVVARDAIARRLRPWLPHARVVASSAPGCWGPAGSIAAAVRSGALADVAWVLITPVDLVPTRPSTVQALLGEARPTVQAVRPTCDGRGGHPVLVRAEVLTRSYLAPGEPPTLRDVLRALGPGCADVSVDDPSTRADLDTPQAYRARTGHDPRFAR